MNECASELLDHGFLPTCLEISPCSLTCKRKDVLKSFFEVLPVRKRMG